MPCLTRRAVTAAAALIMTAAVSAPLPAHAQTLGRMSFPTSGSPEAQPRFMAGLGYLHNFEYDSAAAAFREAQRIDPGFAMAYWGEAMTYTHPVWNQKDAVAARAALARLAPTPEARAAKAPTPRERAYLRAVEVLYGEGDKAYLDTLYAAEMERVAAEFPDDDEARSLHALALLGLSQAERVVPTYMRAGAIALDVLSRNPEHPGALHYAIHAFDDPVHAPLGLPAARAYSRVAPDAPHAQHMTTHIFLALGMWDEVISQNVIAAGPARDRWWPNHYTAWLLYGLLQAGRDDEARDLLQLVHRNAGPRHGGYLMLSRAHYLIESERWRDSAAAFEPPASGWPQARAADAFTRAYAALSTGDSAALAAWRATLDQLAADTAAAIEQVMALQLRAAEAHGAGRIDEAVAMLRDAAAREEGMPVEYGPPAVVKPTWEMMGEMLLAAGRADEAVTAFRRALELAPGRRLSLRGLAAAERASASASGGSPPAGD